VFRKPKGLGADLKAERGLLNDAEGVQSLVDKGFYPLASSGDQVELLSANGEIHVGMNDGVQYILRFGQTTQDANSGKLNRFLFVMATFDESRIPMPEKPAILNTPPAAAPQSSQQSGDQPSKTSDQQSGGSSQSSQNGEQNSQNDQAGTNSGGQQSGAADSSKSAPAGQQPSEEQEAERQKAQKEYQRKLDEREEKIKKGKQRARDLNDRFADWYYVISEDMYRKIHLTRSDIFRTKTGTTEEGFGVDAFRALEKEGLKKSSTP
jgi:hypothetical protein